MLLNGSQKNSKTESKKIPNNTGGYTADGNNTVTGRTVGFGIKSVVVLKCMFDKIAPSGQSALA
jgi:hypothetical protein